MMHLSRNLLAIMLALLTAIRPAQADGYDYGCDWLGSCEQSFLNVVTAQGDANLSVDRSCAGDWRHRWGSGDARQTIRQWVNERAGSGSGSLCIPLHPNVSEVRITSTGGHCGFDADDILTFASAPGADGILRIGFGYGASVSLSGCHAGIGNDEIGTVTYGGIVLDFADGYGFGDSYASGIFYGVYDGFRNRGVQPFGASAYGLSEFNTYHYRIDILANGRTDWRWGHNEERNER